MNNILTSYEKSRSLSFVLIAASIILALIGLFTSNGVLVALGMALAVCLYVFAMYYLDEHNVQGQSIKKHLLALHFFALLAISVAFLQFSRAPGMISYQTIHALADAFLVAGMLLLVDLYKSNLNYTVIAVVSAIAFVLSLLNVNIVLNLLLIFVAAYLIVVTLKESLLSVVLGVVVALFACLAIFGKNTPDMHKYLHVCAVVATLLVAYDFYKYVNKNAIEEDELYRTNVNNLDLSNDSTRVVANTDSLTRSTTRTTKEDTTKTRTRSTKTSYKPDSSWFIKEYENTPYEDILNAPVYAFKGVSEDMAKDLQDAFGIKTIGELADSKYFAWAKEIVEDAK